MRTGERFPINVRTGWLDYSPALRYQASERIRSHLAEFGPQVRSVTIHISDDGPQRTAQRRCEIEVLTAHAGRISFASVGLDAFTLVARVVDSVVELLRQRTSVEPQSEARQRIA